MIRRRMLGDSDEQFVDALYRGVLLRPPDAGGMAHWVNALATGQMTRDQVRAMFYGSPEYTSLQTAIAPTPALPSSGLPVPPLAPSPATPGIAPAGGASWFDGSTEILGYQISNTTLAIGAGVALLLMMNKESKGRRVFA